VKRGDLFYYLGPGPPPQSFALSGAVTGAVAGAPMVNVDGVVAPKMRATLHRRPDIRPTVAELPGSFRRQWQDELNEVGSASMVIANEDAQATLPREGDIVRFEVEGWAVFAWLIREIERVQIANGEEHDQVTTFQGPGLLAILQESIVYPSNGVEMKPVEEERTWGWQSNDYDDSWWGPPAIYPVVDGYQPGSQGEWVVGMDPGSGMVAGCTVWPHRGCERLTAPGATYWLAPGGTCYMRKLMWIAEDDPSRMLIIYALADDECSIYFDGQLQYETSQWENSDADLIRFEVEISPGWHVIAARVHNSEAGPMWSEGFNEWINPWSFMLTVYKMNPITGEIAPDPIIFTDDSWKMVAYPPREPGWTVGEVLHRTLYEAQWQRKGLPGVALAFTGEVDSDGNPWPETTAIATKVGTDYLTFYKELGETYIEFWMEPGSFTIHAWVKGMRGADRTDDIALHAPTDITDPWSGNLAGLSYRKVD